MIPADATRINSWAFVAGSAVAWGQTGIVDR